MKYLCIQAPIRKFLVHSRALTTYGIIFDIMDLTVTVTLLWTMAVANAKYRLEGISIHNISASIHVLSRDILNCSALCVMKFMHGIIALILCHFLNHPIFHVIKWIAKGDPFIVPITRTYGCAFARSLHSHMAQIVGIDNYRTGSGGLMT